MNFKKLIGSSLFAFAGANSAHALLINVEIFNPDRSGNPTTLLAKNSPGREYSSNYGEFGALVTNNTDYQQAIFFDLKLPSGELFSTIRNAASFGPVTAKSSFEAAVAINNKTISRGGVVLNNEGGAEAFGDYPKIADYKPSNYLNSYTFDPDVRSINLGTFAPGESFKISYVFTADAWVNVKPVDCSPFPAGSDCEDRNYVTSGVNMKALSDDPSSYFSPKTLHAEAVVVPEPSALLILFFGLLAVFGLKKRKLI